jgi:hypothetical protein
MTARLVEVKRNGRVESVHSGSIAVVDVDGRLVASSGDPDLFAYFRSSAKPFQAIPLIESGAADYFGLTAAELALCCASHHGSARHQHAVEEFLSKLELPVDAMRCGSPLPIDDVAEYFLVSITHLHFSAIALESTPACWRRAFDADSQSRPTENRRIRFNWRSVLLWERSAGFQQTSYFLRRMAAACQPLALRFDRSRRPMQLLGLPTRHPADLGGSMRQRSTGCDKR